MRYYFVRSDGGIGLVTQGTDPDAVENLRADSLRDHPGDWHSPVCSAPDEVDVRTPPIAIVFADGTDHLLYPDGYMELV